MGFNDRLRYNSVTFFVLSLLIRWLYNLFVWFVPLLTVTQRGVLHLLLAVVSLMFGWFALQLYRRSNSSGSNLGCFYLILLMLNLVGGLGAFFFAIVKFSSDEGGAETLWLV